MNIIKTAFVFSILTIHSVSCAQIRQESIDFLKAQFANGIPFTTTTENMDVAQQLLIARGVDSAKANLIIQKYLEMNNNSKFLKEWNGTYLIDTPIDALISMTLASDATPQYIGAYSLFPTQDAALFAALNSNRFQIPQSQSIFSDPDALMRTSLSALETTLSVSERDVLQSAVDKILYEKAPSNPSDTSLSILVLHAYATQVGNFDFIVKAWNRDAANKNMIVPLLASADSSTTFVVYGVQPVKEILNDNSISSRTRLVIDRFVISYLCNNIEIKEVQVLAKSLLSNPERLRNPEHILRLLKCYLKKTDDNEVRIRYKNMANQLQEAVNSSPP